MIKSEEEALSLVKELSEEEEQVQTLKDEKENLAYILKCKEEELRKLKLVKAYRVKVKASALLRDKVFYSVILSF